MGSTAQTARLVTCAPVYMVSNMIILAIRFIIFIIIFKRITSIQLGIAFHPGANLWVGERLILECRVVGGKHKEQETVVFYRQRELNRGEIISHGDTVIIEDERFQSEKTVFEDLAIYKLEIAQMEIEDGGEYSCEIAGQDETEKERKFVTVSVFERESEEMIAMEEKESEEINFIGPQDVTNSRYVSSVERNDPRFFPPSLMSSSCVDSHSSCYKKYVIIFVTCVLRWLL